MKRFIGLDVHKAVVEVCVIDEKGERVFRRRIDCTREALLRFAEELTGEDSVALEVTTNAWAVADLLRPFVGRIVVSNPMKTKAIAEAKVKTDKVDAEVLAQLLRCDYLPSVWVPDDVTRTLRQLTGRRERLVAERTRLKNRIQSVLASILVPVPVKTLFCQVGLRWLAGCGLPAELRALVESDLRLIAVVDQEIDALEATLRQQAWGLPRVRLLMTVPGMDYCVALSLIAALGDLSRFEDGEHAASYLGLTPSVKQSAATCHYGPITKRGNSHARWLLTQAAQNMARQPGPLGVFFRRLAKRKCWNVAVCATARKLVGVAWLMLKNNEPYRYANPTTTQRKLSRLRVAVTGELRKPEHKGRRPGVKNGANPPSRLEPSLQRVCEQEGLPPVHGFEQLPAGEQQVLRTLGVIDFVQQINQDRRSPRKSPTRARN
ncbi:Transposase IS116/IS110/IS902 family protein [Pirellulimonas nuda]|uniref:Transposase IS116/IS110/IS902 family protein n=1 Tax=Pirellulimonas nuda TaxID=2528009 RepID=A0A518DD45_9BACT|nr:IS110 family transposase [Pirellulimonas nuda]QDU89373.1 Transposase IS116/IS110/IS902 family protein [Pirellulimonas nuda]